MNLSRSVYLRPKKEDLELFKIQPNELLDLLLPLYGLCDAGDYWGVTLDIHITEDLGMKATKRDRAVYTWTQGEDICRISGTYVDDSLNAGIAEFQKHTEQTLRKFESKPRVWDTFDFYGAKVNTTEDQTF